MGLYDRPYYREEEPRSFQLGLGRERSMVINLILINVAVFVVDLLSKGFGERNWLSFLLALRAEDLIHPWYWWRFISYGFAHSPANAFHVIGNMLGLFIFGREVESVYGRGAFLRMYLTAIGLGSIAWATKEYLLLGNPESSLIGASGAVTAVIILFALHFPNRTVLFMLVIPVPAWVIGVMLIAYNLLAFPASVAEGGGRIAFDVHLVGAGYGLFYYFYRLDFTSIWPRSISWDVLKRKPKLRVHRPDAPNSKLDVEADRVLDKLHREGADSLSPKERRTLEEYSRRMRQKRR
jgi:membrane associated rhomboid family serine protease